MVAGPASSTWKSGKVANVSSTKARPQGERISHHTMTETMPSEPQSPKESKRRRRGHSEREALEVFYNNPCRFLGQNPPPNTWIPFGGGVRRCLGAGFSLMEGVAVLREVLTAYERAGVLRLLHEPGQDYDQATW